MALITRSREADVSINLLPSEIKTEQNTQRRFQIAVGIAVAILVILGLITVMQRMQIASSERTLRAEQAKAADLRTQVAALREYEEMKATIDGTRATLATALTGDISWTRFLDDLDTYMPEDSWLSSLTVNAVTGSTPQGEVSLGTATYQGSVKSMPGLANWLDTMSGIKGLNFVYLANGSKSEVDGQKVVNFSASAHVNDFMLSKRCQGEGSQCP